MIKPIISGGLLGIAILAIVFYFMPNDAKYVKHHNCKWVRLNPNHQTMVIWGVKVRYPDHDVYQCEGVDDEIELPHR